MDSPVLFEKYTIDILLYLRDVGEVPRSRFNGLKGEYNLVIDRVEELVEEGFIRAVKPRFGNVKKLYRLTPEGKTIADEIMKIEEMAQDLKKD